MRIGNVSIHILDAGQSFVRSLLYTALVRNSEFTLPNANRNLPYLYYMAERHGVLIKYFAEL